MSVIYASAVTRIFASNNKDFVVGTGFLVGPRLVATCVHVINDALNLGKNNKEQPDTKVNLDLPFVSSSPKFTAHVVHWDYENDIAGLELVGALTEELLPAKLAITDDIWNHPFKTIGFPADYAQEGVWAMGNIIGPQAKGLALIKGTIEKTGYNIQPGFSGAPVWDETSGQIAGMVKKAELDSSIGAASIIVAATLRQSWAALEAYVPLECPYRGMAAFEPEHAKFYFGRKAMISKLVTKVAEDTFSPIIVVGPSGSGKSSLVRAGLIPALRSGLVPWKEIVLKPYKDPWKSLAAPLVDLLEPDLKEIERLDQIEKLTGMFRDSKQILTQILERIQDKYHQSSLLILIDQFEELYRYDTASSTQKNFTKALLDAAKYSHVKVIIAVRADFFGNILSDPSLGPVVDQWQVNVLPMTDDELCEAIEQPAIGLGRKFEPGLVQEILRHVTGQRGNLPLLEFALTEIWERQTPEGLLTFSAYNAIGQVQGAVARRADDELARFEKEGRGDIVRQIFTRLVLPGQGTIDTRRRASREELEAIERFKTNEVWQVVLALADARLIVTGYDSATKADTAEVAHEALIQSWDKLRSWLNSKREFYSWRQARLEPMLNQWKENGQLLQDAELTDAMLWLEDQPLELNYEERDYIYHSILSDPGVNLEYWLRQYGTVSETLSLIEPYLQSNNAKQRGKGVRALGWLPSSELDPSIYQRLQEFVVHDESLSVANLATQAICQRGDIGKLTSLLESPLTREDRDRLVKSLGITRNLPKIGKRVVPELKTDKRRVLLQAALELVLEYQSEFAIILVFIFAAETLISLTVDQIISFVSAAFRSSLNLDMSFTSLDLILLFGFITFRYIRRRFIDFEPLELRDLYTGIQAVLALNAVLYLFSITRSVINYIGQNSRPVTSLTDLAGSVVNAFAPISIAYLGDFFALLVASYLLCKYILFSGFEGTRRAKAQRAFFISLQTIVSGSVVKAFILVILSGFVLFVFRQSLFGLPGGDILPIVISNVIRNLSSLIDDVVYLFATLLGFYLGFEFIFKNKTLSPS